MGGETEATGTLRLRAWGFLLASIGGFLAALGGLLQWSVIPEFPDEGIRGIDLGLGWAALVAGLVCIVAIYAMRFLPTYEARRIAGVIVILGGLTALALSVYTFLNLDTVVFGPVEERARAGLEAIAGPDADVDRPTLEKIEAEIEKQADAVPSFGLFMVAGGGLMAVAGGVVGLRWARKRADINEAQGRSFGARRGAVPEEAPRADSEDDPNPSGSAGSG